jgi:tRNA nucleotidyltransferase (CCA-adding enzyme)
VVGGAPRDGLLGRRAIDVDVAVTEGAEELARELARRGFGTAVPISESSPRVFRVAGPLELDLAELEGASIEQDLGRRDFTVNAIAIDLESWRWIDPFGGAADLANGRLRVLRESNLDEDPLRAFRAARFYAALDLRPDRRTRRACLAVAPRLSKVAPERIRTELSRMLEARKVAPAFRWAAGAHLLGPALALEARPGRFQAAARILGRLDDLPRAARLPRSRRRRLGLAAIAMGLELTPRDTVRWLHSRRYGRAEASAVSSLVELVQQAEVARGPGERWRWVYDAGPLAEDASMLLAAARPRRGALAQRLRRLAARRRTAPVVTGADVVEWLKLPPGPRVGQLLRELRIQILCGAVRSRPHARRWLTEYEDRRVGSGNSEFLKES